MMTTMMLSTINLHPTASWLEGGGIPWQLDRNTATEPSTLISSPSCLDPHEVIRTSQRGRGQDGSLPLIFASPTNIIGTVNWSDGPKSTRLLPDHSSKTVAPLIQARPRRTALRTSPKGRAGCWAPIYRAYGGEHKFSRPLAHCFW
jgi:hypothetical protein